MSTLLLRLGGPMQSWGTQSRFSVRDTGTEPSKSGVIGLICAALGKPRVENQHDTALPRLSELTSLRMGVRIDHQGRIEQDFHTAGGTHRKGATYGVAKADGSAPGPVTSTRFFLADASFLVALESAQTGLLETVHNALRKPRWPLSLGRKSFPPGEPVYLDDGLKDGDLVTELTVYPWVANSLRDAQQAMDAARAGNHRLLQLVLDSQDTAASDIRYDVPLDFCARLFGPRHVRYEAAPLTEQMVKEGWHVPLETHP